MEIFLRAYKKKKTAWNDNLSDMFFSAKKFNSVLKKFTDSPSLKNENISKLNL